MSKYFNKEYGVKTIEVMPPLKRKSFEKLNKQNERFIIAMSGQVYAVEELDSLLTALDMIDWQIDGKKVYFEHYGMWNPNYIDLKKHHKFSDRIHCFKFRLSFNCFTYRN